MKELQEFPLDQYPDVKSLCVEVIKRFSRTDLHNSNALRYDSGGVPTTPEAQFKEEFYAAAKKLLGDRIVLSSEWSNDGEGRIDFRIVNTKWGVELLRNGDRLAEHCGRFEPGGLYYGAIDRGDMIDWLVIDCTHLKPRRFTAFPNAKLVRAVFAEDYSSAEILDAYNVVVAPMFPLLS